MTMGCLYLEIEVQSCLLDNYDQGLMKNRQIDLLDSMTKKEPEKIYISFFPHSEVTRNISANNPKQKINENILAKLSALLCHGSLSVLSLTSILLHRSYCSIRSFFTRWDSASRKRPFSTGLFFDWIFLVLLIVNRVDFIVFVLFLEAVGVRERCCMAVENRLAALCSARSSRATRASRATNLRPSGLVALGLVESRQSYVRGVALSPEPPKLQQA